MRPHFDRRTALLFIMPALFCLLGVGLLAPAIWAGYQSWAFLQIAQATPGIVTALEWSDDSDSSGARPVVRYDRRGSTHGSTSGLFRRCSVVWACCSRWLESALATPFGTALASSPKEWYLP